MRTFLTLGFVGVVLLGGLPAAADVQSDLAGTRSLAMGGAHRAVGTSNETLWMNPAGMALSRRYNIDLQYAYATHDRLNHLNGSVVDSKSGPVAGGMSLTRDWGNESGVNPTLNRLYVGTAYALGGSVAFGLTGAYVRGDYNTKAGRQQINAVNTTVGALISLGEFLSVGASYQNFFQTGDSALLVPMVGVGTGIRAQALALAGDLTVDMRHNIEERIAYHAGAEYFLFESVALRAGYRRGGVDSTPNGKRLNFVSGGAGLVSPTGALHASAERALDVKTPNWRFVASFQFFL